ncbi:hypothetical protein JKP88DRAFT_348859 [Tribonema minus]|uniref:Uncharacterized protein n=1 Tax=Tribonema minus TaxID=303371 RepID=A0A836CFY7_9STRA|nr:hypothetical protein JKP88DRAFT_348859 [Tribonema minus]
MLSREGPIVQVRNPPFAAAALAKREGGALTHPHSHTASPSQLKRPLPPPTSGSSQASGGDGSVVAEAAIPDTVDQSQVSCLLVFAEMRAWRSVAAAAEALPASGALSPSDAADVRMCRATALLRMRHVDDAQAELQRVQRASAAAATPAPFAAELLALQIGLFKGTLSSDDAIASLGTLKRALDARIAAAAASPATESGYTAAAAAAAAAAALTAQEAVRWRRRVRTTLASAFQVMGRWRAALAELQANDDDLRGVLASGGSSSSSGGGGSAALLAARGEVNSRIGRVFLQIGDVHSATTFYNRAERMWAAAGSSGAGAADAALHRAQALINAGLLAFARSDFRGAAERHERAAAEARTARTLAAGGGGGGGGGSGAACAGVEGEGAGALLAAAASNAALAHLYACDVARALAAAEGAAREDPAAALRDTTAFNLCTLYDLGGGPAGSATRKAALAALAQRFSLDDVDVGSFRM